MNEPVPGATTFAEEVSARAVTLPDGVGYALSPHAASDAGAARPASFDALGEELGERLRGGPVTYDFRVQSADTASAALELRAGTGRLVASQAIRFVK